MVAAIGDGVGYDAKPSFIAVWLGGGITVSETRRHVQTFGNRY